VTSCVQHVLILAFIAQQAPVPSAPAPSAVAIEKASVAKNADGQRPRPVLVLAVAPEFTERAGKQHVSGNVEVSTLVDRNGIPQNVMVVHGLGLGLDEKAVEAVRQYRFKPALSKEGVPVPMTVHLTVSFQLN